VDSGVPLPKARTNVSFFLRQRVAPRRQASRPILFPKMKQWKAFSSFIGVDGTNTHSEQRRRHPDQSQSPLAHAKTKSTLPMSSARLAPPRAPGRPKAEGVPSLFLPKPDPGPGRGRPASARNAILNKNKTALKKCDCAKEPRFTWISCRAVYRQIDIVFPRTSATGSAHRSFKSGALVASIIHQIRPPGGRFFSPPRLCACFPADRNFDNTSLRCFLAAARSPPRIFYFYTLTNDIYYNLNYINNMPNINPAQCKYPWVMEGSRASSSTGSGFAEKYLCKICPTGTQGPAPTLHRFDSARLLLRPSGRSIHQASFPVVTLSFKIWRPKGRFWRLR